MQVRRQGSRSTSLSLSLLRSGSPVRPRRTRAALCSLAAIATLALAAPVAGQTFEGGKAKFDRSEFRPAAQDFEVVSQRPGDSKRADAAVFALRSLSQAGDHAAVLAKYEQCRAAVAGTPLEGELEFEVAKSTHHNAKDTTAALQGYARVLQQYPENVFAASGALYERASIERDDMKAHNAAHATLEDMITRYPTSPFVDDALVSEAKNAGMMGRMDIIDSADKRLELMNAASSMRQKVQLERAECHIKTRGDRRKAIAAYNQTFRRYGDGTDAAAVARIRAADLVVGGDFRESLNLYKVVLECYPKLRKSQRDWAQCQSGVYHYQLRENDEARSCFETVLAANPARNVRSLAQVYLDGMSHPDSTSSLLITYDRALRYYQTELCSDQTFLALGEYEAMTHKPFFAEYLRDSSISNQEKAEFLYRLSFADFYTGRGKDAFDLCERILKDYKPTGNVRFECLYMRAYLLGRGARWEEAVTAWEELQAENPPVDILAASYPELARAQHLSNDPLGAAMTLEEFQVRLPARHETEKGQMLSRELLRRYPEVAKPLQEQKPLIVARWKEKAPPPEAPDPYSPTIASTMQVINNVGGAE